MYSSSDKNRSMVALVFIFILAVLIIAGYFNLINRPQAEITTGPTEEIPPSKVVDVNELAPSETIIILDALSAPLPASK